MMRFTLTAAICALAAASLATAAAAQTDDDAADASGDIPDGSTLVPGVERHSTVAGAPKASNGDFFRCFKLDTERGSRWTVQVSQKKRDGEYLTMGVFAGDKCDIAAILPAEYKTQYLAATFGDRYGTQATFSSGGGRYSIGVFGAPAKRLGGFRIAATQLAKGGTIKDGLLASEREQSFAKETEGQTASTVPPKDAKKYAVGDLISDGPDYPQMIVVPAGNFIMGSSASEEERQGDEGPAHRVTFANPFAMGVTEVTFAQYDKCVADGACTKAEDGGWGRGKRPAINVSWTDARAYAAWLSEKTGERYFLPSESEWEYAARAGTKEPWNTGSAIVSDDANIMNAFKQTVPVGGFPANAWGLKDVHGNVWEWTLDCKEVGYFGVPEDGGAAMTAGCPTRVLRGGSWGSEPQHARSARRGADAPTAKGPHYGFRVARAL